MRGPLPQRKGTSSTLKSNSNENEMCMQGISDVDANFHPPCRITPMQKLVWEQVAKRHVPLQPLVLHQGYKSKGESFNIWVFTHLCISVPLIAVTKSDFIAPEEAI